MIDNAKIPFFPESWEYLLVKDAIDKISLTNRKLKQKEYLQEGKLPVVDQGQELIGGYTNKEEMNISSETPLIIFGDHTRVFKYITFDFVAGADGVKVLKPKGMYLSKLLFYLLQGARLPNKGYARHFQYLEKSYIPLPPLPEQNRIVAKIDELFTRLDAGVEALKQVQTQLKCYRQSVLKEAVEGRLTAEWREMHKNELEPADKLLERILKEHREKWEAEQLATYEGQGKTPPNNWQEKYKDPTQNKIDNHIEVPGGWVWAKVDWPCTSQTGPFGTQLHKSDYTDHGVPTIEIGDVYPDRDIRDGTAHYVSEKKAKTLKKFTIKHNDILFTRVGTVGRCTIVPEGCNDWIMSTSLIRVRNFSKYLHPRYLLYYFQSPIAQFFVKKTTKGTTRAGTNSKIVGNLPLILPPLIEQRQIIAEIERRLSIINSVNDNLENNFFRIKHLRQSILKRAFEGKLVPQDPNDEPASALLERIKAEKAKSKKSKQMEMF